MSFNSCLKFGNIIVMKRLVQKYEEKLVHNIKALRKINDLLSELIVGY